MKKSICLLFLCFVILGCKAAVNSGNTPSPDSTKGAKQEFIVKTLSDEQGFNEKTFEVLGGKVEAVMSIDKAYAYRLVSAYGSDFEKKLNAVNGVVYVLPNSEIKTSEYWKADTKPENKIFPFAIDSDGEIKKDPEGNLAEYALRITKARNFYNDKGEKQDGAYKVAGYGNHEVVLGIIDSGMNMNHEDFKDSSGNSIVLYAKSAFQKNIGPGGDFPPSQPNLRVLDIPSNEDASGHGTHCTGSMCAVGDNDKGICGVAWKNTKVISYKGLGKKSGSLWSIYGSLRDFTEITSILKKDPAARSAAESAKIPASVPAGYRITHKTIPVNMSLSGNVLEVFENEMVNYALANDVMPICAMGNDGRALPNFPSNVSGVISVGATTSIDEKAIFSNSGQLISVCAPGQNIISCFNGNWNSQPPQDDTTGYVNLNGTSMATPFVTGMIGYLLSFDGARNLTPYQIKRILEETADKIDSDNPHYGYNADGFSEYYGYGRVNVLEAVKCITGKGKPVPPAGEFYSEHAVRIKVSHAGNPHQNAKVFLYETSSSVNIAAAITNTAGLAEFRGLEKGKNYKVKARINSTLSGEVKEVEFTAPVTDTEYEIAF